jgi:hypothetical protein
MTLINDPANNYVALLAGDVHHYERHPVRLPDGRVMQHVITGGGGAFMTSTHQIPRIDLDHVGEDEWVVFPTRADSLRAYSIVLLRKLRRVLFWRRNEPLRGIPADEASVIVSRRHGLDLDAELSRGERDGSAGPIRVSWRSRLLAALIFPQRAWFESSRISEALDWDDPPFFKNFLRLDVADSMLTITAFGVTGCARDEDDPVVIDRMEIQL